MVFGCGLGIFILSRAQSANILTCHEITGCWNGRNLNFSAGTKASFLWVENEIARCAEKFNII